jgi:hypothetical protein
MVYQKHPSFPEPENKDGKIWRFMDFTKFVDILTSQSLYFCRSDLLGDPFEGHYTPFMIDELLKIAETEEDKKMIRGHFIKSPREWRKTSFLNCWYMDDVEPASMWKLYTVSNHALAIQSTFSKLIQSFENNKKYSIFVGKVNYIDYKKNRIPYGNAFDPLLYKRHNFKHERELRAVVVDFNFLGTNKEPLIGHRVNSDLAKLIEEIRLAPTAPDWFKNNVKSLMKKFDLDKPVINSELDENPPT